MLSDQPKDKSFLDSLGPKVEMSTDKLGDMPNAQEMLKNLGQMVCNQSGQVAQGMEYVGSFAFHIMRTKDGFGAMTGEYNMNSITQIALDENCSEQMSALAFSNGVIQMRRYWDPSYKVGRRGDDR